MDSSFDPVHQARQPVLDATKEIEGRRGCKKHGQAIPQKDTRETEQLELAFSDCGCIPLPHGGLVLPGHP